MKKSILNATIFKLEPNGNGGNHRATQIAELVNLAELEVSAVKNISTTRWSRYINGIRFLAKHPFKIHFSPKMIGLCGYYYQTYKHAIEQHTSVKLLVLETTNNYICIYAAKEKNFKILAVPQNIESLVLGQKDPFTRQFLPESLENEIKYLAKSDAIFCISREEQWLLRLRGIDADFLPYYPAKSILSNLLEIRKLRNHLQNQKFLILGSATNKPTLVGMIEQIQWLNQLEKAINFEVDIAGHGTEQLKEYCDRPNFTLHGTVDSQKLNHLLINAKAVLVHQKAGVGALTRIPEMVIAGIPVIANGNACRSAFSYPGVYCYDNQSELADLMSKPLDSPDILPRPIEAEKRFINCLKQLAD